MTGPTSARIIGVGHTALRARLDRTAWSLQAEAVRAAVADAGLAPGDIDGLLTEPGYSQPVIEGVTPHYLRLGAMLGLNPRYTGSEVLGGASSVAMVQRAAMAVAAGLCRVCVCVLGARRRHRAAGVSARRAMSPYMAVAL